MDMVNTPLGLDRRQHVARAFSTFIPNFKWRRPYIVDLFITLKIFSCLGLSCVDRLVPVSSDISFPE